MTIASLRFKAKWVRNGSGFRDFQRSLILHMAESIHIFLGAVSIPFNTSRGGLPRSAGAGQHYWRAAGHERRLVEGRTDRARNPGVTRPVRDTRHRIESSAPPGATEGILGVTQLGKDRRFVRFPGNEERVVGPHPV